MVDDVAAESAKKLKEVSMRIHELPEAALWIDQFSQSAEDFQLAQRLLDRLHFVTATRFAADVQELLRSKFLGHGATALYVERELQKTRSTTPPAMYRAEKIRIPGRRRFVRRAVGAAVPAVKSMTNAQQEIGSEGPLAQVLSQFCSRHRNKFLLQPSAEEMRRKRVRQLVVVTDFIGSGDRICRMLDSIWKVASVRSWNSGQFVRLSVVAFTGTSTGIAAVSKHRSHPDVYVVMDCPTIWTSFTGEESIKIEDLCQRYGTASARPLGYGNVGALVAFEHSCPNNAPSILIESSESHLRPWRPLFERRATSHIFARSSEPNTVDFGLLFESLGYPSIAQSSAFHRSRREQRYMYLLLAALSKRNRTVPSLVRSTALSLQVLNSALEMATGLGLVRNRRLLPAGGKELDRLVRSRSLIPTANRAASMYYPSALRFPKR